MGGARPCNLISSVNTPMSRPRRAKATIRVTSEVYIVRDALSHPRKHKVTFTVTRNSGSLCEMNLHKSKRTWQSGHSCSKSYMIKNYRSRISSSDKQNHVLIDFINGKEGPAVEQDYQIKEKDQETSPFLEEFDPHFTSSSLPVVSTTKNHSDVYFTGNAAFLIAVDNLEHLTYAQRISFAADYRSHSAVQYFRFRGRI